MSRKSLVYIRNSGEKEKKKNKINANIYVFSLYFCITNNFIFYINNDNKQS
jgi:hypothetical protein